MAKRRFKTNVRIFLAVNVLVALAWIAVLVAGLQISGELWIYPLAMVVWACLIAIQGYSAYHPTSYPEERINREMRSLS